MPSKALSAIEQAEVATKYFSSIWSTLQLTVLKEQGGDALASLKTRILRRHQRDYFLQGIDKLGIDRSLPPAVVAGQYHYLSNMLGGLIMEYVEESPKKVWVRYLPPAYSWPGVSIAAVPATVQRSMFSGWHPNNGASLGTKRLAFIVTKVYQDGEIYDEGFFQEYDRDLADDERIQFRPVVSSPPFDLKAAPKLDPKKWPLERQAKAKRNFSQGFVEEGIKSAFERWGLYTTAYYLGQSARFCAMQFFHEFEKLLGGAGKSAEDFANIFAELWRACGENVEVSKEASNRVILTRTNRMFSDGDVGREIYDALFQYVKTAAKIFNPKLHVVLDHEQLGKAAAERWIIEETSGRLF